MPAIGPGWPGQAREWETQRSAWSGCRLFHNFRFDPVGTNLSVTKCATVFSVAAGKRPPWNQACAPAFQPSRPRSHRRLLRNERLQVHGRALMTDEMQSTANDLIHALGALAVAQEQRSDSDEIAGLTERAVNLQDALKLNFQAS